MSTLPERNDAQFFYPCLKSCALHRESSGGTCVAADPAPLERARASIRSSRRNLKFGGEALIFGHAVAPGPSVGVTPNPAPVGVKFERLSYQLEAKPK
jgi:hypothetical protein